MNTIFLAMLNGWEVVVILAIVLVLFGAKKLPELARGLGRGIKEFKSASREATEDLHNTVLEEPAPPRQELAPTSHEADPHSSPDSTPAKQKS